MYLTDIFHLLSKTQRLSKTLYVMYLSLSANEILKFHCMTEQVTYQSKYLTSDWLKISMGFDIHILIGFLENRIFLGNLIKCSKHRIPRKEKQRETQE